MGDKTPTYLGEAHARLMTAYPPAGAELETWLSFFRRSAALYERMASVYPAALDEARYWAQREREHAEQVTALIAADKAVRNRADRRFRGGVNRYAVTLREAENRLGVERPSINAPSDLWIAHHDHAAQVYADVAEIDRFHHHEARGYAARERRYADEARAVLDHVMKRKEAAAQHKAARADGLTQGENVAVAVLEAGGDAVS